MTLEEEIRNVARLRKRNEILQRRAKEAKQAYDQAQLALWERMDGTGISSIGIAGTMHVRKCTIYGTVNDKAALEAWALENGREDLFAPAPRKGLVNELVRQCIDNNEPLPPGVDFYVDKYVSQTKQ